ncbi:bifunctional purple acid phosphatase 26-like [Mercurialis annua]|uniref:bifunctional purple acid phosphatase 26-like n=1 Tax=Mercurialis annua TaxID=3986 RepID=UPI00215F3720|nr:bifunctional purple acid phosphatase 26-like [Mercurialis annua]
MGAMNGVIVRLFVVMLGLVSHGNAGITSSYVRSAFPSADIPLDNPVFAPPPGYNAPQQVHIIQGDYNGNAVLVSWVTPDEPGSNTVRFGKSKKQYDFTAEGTVTDFTFYQYKSGYIHKCFLKNLESDTKYYYKLGTGKSAREFWFQTPPAINPDVPYKFGVIGDLGQTYNSLSTLVHLRKSEAKAVLFLGDLSYADKYEYNDVPIRWDSWGRFVENSTAYMPWFWSVGNHEVEFFPYMGETIPFKNYVYRYPTPYLASNSTSPLWYSIRRASAHIIVLNSYSAFVVYSPQWFWLQQELANVNREETPWLFVITHAPLYNSNEVHFMEAEGMRIAFESWFIQYKVDAVFSGHVHAYERSNRYSNIRCKVSSGFCYPVPDKSAPVYITVGDGGNQEGLATKYMDPQPHYSAFREASYGHGTLEIMNRTHAFFSWHRNDDGEHVVADSLLLNNQYWTSKKVKKHNLRSFVDESTI